MMEFLEDVKGKDYSCVMCGSTAAVSLGFHDGVCSNKIMLCDSSLNDLLRGIIGHVAADAIKPGVK